ncbi:hypothetical protein A2311_00050 [candidate division WOR-1 bacterium RIFOXYB2_FULL_48_7]|uniref:DUF4878 domain-containing protein n=1 Tax=candidate division WOR-1 bacterium RIFOXYB2_FULL_48_7 TaxID=1802583 RepID=A0A1F4TJK8_UNCSA|nr:MAG: hypothetical protein A2311_00050 [candidate division WOR-1 bacterium RIFOXYB2_FULL_48_7]
MKNKILALGLILALSYPLQALTLKETIHATQQALLEKNTKVVYQNIALQGIVNSKIKKFTRLAKKQDSLAGKMIGWSEPLLLKSATGFIMGEFNRSSRGLRQSYLNSFQLGKVVENGAYGYATATFLGAKAVLSAVKDNNGNWQIVGAESPVLDKEFNNLLKILKATK